MAFFPRRRPNRRNHDHDPNGRGKPERAAGPELQKDRIAEVRLSRQVRERCDIREQQRCAPRDVQRPGVTKKGAIRTYAINTPLESPMIPRGGRYVLVGQLGTGTTTFRPALIGSKQLRIFGLLSGRAKAYWKALDFISTRKGSVPF